MSDLISMKDEMISRISTLSSIKIPKQRKSSLFGKPAMLSRLQKHNLQSYKNRIQKQIDNYERQIEDIDDYLKQKNILPETQTQIPNPRIVPYPRLLQTRKINTRNFRK